MKNLIDMHTHLPRHAADASADRLTRAALARLERYGMRAAVVMPLDGLLGDVAADNDAVVSVCEPSGGRLVGAGTVNPHDPGAVAELERCAARGIRALKLHPWLQGFSPLEPEARAVARRAAEIGIPLLVHDGTPPYASPLQIGELAGSVPECTVVLAHGGLLDLWQDAIAAVLRWPNVMVTLCGTASRSVLARVLDSVPAERVALGTDAGFGDDDLTTHRLAVAERLVAALPSGAADAVIYRNAARWLGLP